MTPMLVEGMLGLGDNIYQVPVVKELVRIYHSVYLQTPWPQLYQGIENLHFCKTLTRLRTQQKNVQKSSSVYSFLPPVFPHELLHLSYVAHQRRGMPLYQGLSSVLGPYFKYHLKLLDPCQNRK